MTGKQLGAMHEKDKKSGPPTSGHFEAADNGGYMLTMHSKNEMGDSSRTVHPSKKHMLKHMDAALGMGPAAPAMTRKPSGNLIKGPGPQKGY